MTRQPTRGQRNADWIERFCLIPHGPDKGCRVALTAQQREEVCRLYDGPGGLQSAEPISAPLSSYLVLLHLAGPEAPSTAGPPPHLFKAADLFTATGALGPELRPYVRREANKLTCGELGTSWPNAA